MSQVPDIFESHLEISDDIIAELTIQAKGYAWLFNGDVKKIQELSMNALRAYGSDKVYTIPVTQDMLDVGDFGFRMKEIPS